MNAQYKPTIWLAAFLITTYCALAWSEELVSKTVPLENISEITLEGGAQLHIIQDDKEYVKVTAHQQLLSQIDAVIKGQSLTLSTKQSFWRMFEFGTDVKFEVHVKNPEILNISGSATVTVDPIKVDRFELISQGSGKLQFATIKADRVDIEGLGSCRLKFDSIEANTITVNSKGSCNSQLSLSKSNHLKVSVAGSGNVRFDNIDADNFSLSTAGSATVKLNTLTADHWTVSTKGSGFVDIKEPSSVKKLKLKILGSGIFNGYTLNAQHADVSLTGSSNAEVSVTDHLKAKVSGAGKLQYKGSPKLVTKTNGAGSITATN